MNKFDFRSSTYQITEDTLYIRTARKHNAVTEIEEIYQTRYTMQRSLKIIDQACIQNGSTYTGRVNAAKQLLGIHYNPPIAIDPYRGIYAFATLSPLDENCIWVITKNIIDIKHNNKGSTIYYKNNKSLHILMSKHQVDRLCAHLYKYLLIFRRD